MNDFDRFATYYKIIGANNYGKYPYKLGLNTLADNGETFNEEPICGPGGLYFSDIKYIFEYLDYGDKVCTLTIPDDAQVIKVNNKYKADKIYIREMMEINYDAIKYLVEYGADITADDNYAIRWAANYGYFEIIKYLTENGADVTTLDNTAIRLAAYYGYLDIVQYLVENGADVTVWDNFAIRWAAMNGHLDVVQYLSKHGAILS